MSSSQQSSSIEANLLSCPLCGSERMVRLTSDVTLTIRSVTQTFVAVSHQRCDACGERVFDLAQSRRFDAVFLAGVRRPRRRAA